MSTDRIDDGGPAFPSQELNADGTPYALNIGMSLRDHFAGEAMPALLQICRNDPSKSGENYIDYCARKSYEMADAMLRARATKGGEA